MGLSCDNGNAAATKSSGVVMGARFPEFVDPVIINGKTFERVDLPGIVNTVTSLLCAAQSRPANQKVSAARFLLGAEATGVVTLKSSIRKYCNQLLS